MFQLHVLIVFEISSGTRLCEHRRKVWLDLVSAQVFGEEFLCQQDMLEKPQSLRPQLTSPITPPKGVFYPQESDGSLQGRGELHLKLFIKYGLTWPEMRLTDADFLTPEEREHHIAEQPRVHAYRAPEPDSPKPSATSFAHPEQDDMSDIHSIGLYDFRQEPAWGSLGLKFPHAQDKKPRYPSPPLPFDDPFSSHCFPTNKTEHSINPLSSSHYKPAPNPDREVTKDSEARRMTTISTKKFLSGAHPDDCFWFEDQAIKNANSLCQAQTDHISGHEGDFKTKKTIEETQWLPRNEKMRM
jgi:hypothetical protein